MSKLAHSPAADPSLAQPARGREPPRLRAGQARTSRSTTRSSIRARRTNAPDIFKQIGWAPYPGIEAGKPAKAPIGGINWGVGAYTKHPQEAFEAAACMRNAENQKEAAIKGGLPPTLASLYDDPELDQGLSVRRPDPQAARQTRAVRPVDAGLRRTSRWRSPRRSRRRSSIKTDGFVDALRGNAQGRPRTRRHCYERRPSPKPLPAPRAALRSRRPTRAKAERKLGLDAVRAGRRS